MVKMNNKTKLLIELLEQNSDLIEFIEEVSRGLFLDSDAESLCETLAARASQLLLEYS